VTREYLAPGIGEAAGVLATGPAARGEAAERSADSPSLVPTGEGWPKAGVGAVLHARNAMKHITVGVAGHIDHGKTALVRALTGVHTDRLPEEQQRGMSIVLGFAPLSLPEGEVDFIDVPGHEKFVGAMIAGAGGLDAVLLVVDANERIKPQSVEHTALAGLLGVRKGVVVLAKADGVTGRAARVSVEEDIRRFAAGTFLAGAPVVWTSAVTGEGLDALRAHLGGLLNAAVAPEEFSHFILPIDRAFTMTGHGTVVTGTLRRGALHVGQGVEVQPGGAKADVRGLEIHGVPVAAARPGWRVAVNLRGVKKEEIGRGDTLATPGAVVPTCAFQAEFHLLCSAPALAQGARVRVHSGAGDVCARVRFLDCEGLAPGGTAFAQFRLQAPVAALACDAFVVRALSPAATLGGGIILDAAPTRRARADTIIRLRTLAHGTDTEKIDALLRDAGGAGLDERRLGLLLGRHSRQVDAALAALTPPAIVCADALRLHPAAYAEIVAAIQKHVQAFHGTHPTLPGIPRAELRARLLPTLAASAFARALEGLVRQGALIVDGGVVRAAGWAAGAGLTVKEQEIAGRIELRFRDAGLSPPNIPDVLGTDKRWRVLYHYLVAQGTLVETVDRTNNRTVTFHRDALARAEGDLHALLGDGGGLTVSQVNAALGMTRKNAIPLLEYFDAQGLTRRVGNAREWARATQGDSNKTNGEGGDDVADDLVRLTDMVSVAG